MNIRYANHARPQLPRYCIILRRLLIDILPTFLLLLAMAAGMSMVARFSDSLSQPSLPEELVISQISE